MFLFLNIRSLFIILLLLTHVVFSQHYRFTTYTAVDGLSQNGVYSLLEDSRGNIWMGTRGGGLNKFDGIRFTPYTTFDGLSDNGILCLHEDGEGFLWIGTEDGLNRYNGKTFTSFFCEENPDQPFVIAGIAETPDHELIFASTKGIFTIENEKLVQKPIDLSFEHLGFLTGSGSDIWFGVSNRLYNISDKGYSEFDHRNGLGRSRMAYAATANGKLIVSCYADGLYILKNGRFAPFLRNRGMDDKYINTLYADSRNSLWIGTNNSGVYKVDLNSLEITELNSSDGLANDHVESILEDSWGNIWMGTGGSGVSKYHRASFSQITEQNGLPGNWIYAAARDTAGRIWLGAGNGGLSVMTDSTLDIYNSFNGFIHSKVRLIYKDQYDRMWLAPEGGGLWVYDSMFHQVRSDRPGVPFDHIKAITQSSDGRMWACEGGKGLVSFQLDSLYTARIDQHLTTREGLPRNYIYSLHADKTDRIWFGTRNRGGGYIYNGRIVALGVKDGLASNTVVMIDEDPDGFIWLAGGDGITRIAAFKNPVEFEKYGRESGIEGNPVYQVLSDTNGYLWVGTSKGITRFLLDNGVLSSPKHFGYSDGFTGLETNANAIVATTNGRVFFGTGDGLMVYEGEDSLEKIRPPIVSLVDIKLFYESITSTRYGEVFSNWFRMKDDLELPHDQNNLGFEFIGISHVNPDKVLYSWILEGFDRNWTPLQHKTDASYSNLPPGSYVFRVRAANSEGILSETVSTRTIRILSPPPPPPPFWQKTWFIVTVSCIGLLIVVLVFLVLYIRINRDRERLTMERNVLELEQKALRLQMNPHFIFNALNSVQGLISLKDTKQAKYQLAKFSKLMRQILDNSRSQMITLEDEMATLETYLTIERSCTSESFDFEIVCDSDVEPETVLIPPMLIQPFAENAVIHGLRNIKRKGHISIHFGIAGNLMECRIEDNGIGREETAKLKNQKGQFHKSVALDVTQERIDLLGGSGKKGMEIIDKKDIDGEAFGTIVIIRFPLHYR